MHTSPGPQGLYHPSFEHDACGIGAVADIRGRKTHATIIKALTILNNLEHRGARGSDERTGDGAGILIQISHSFFQKACGSLDIPLPGEGEYGVGMFFLPRDPQQQQHCQYVFEQSVSREGQGFLGWRELPLDVACIGPTAQDCMPRILQAFVSRGENVQDAMDFERKLYLIRKQTETILKRENISSFYVSSLSSRTIVYKGMLLAEQLGVFYKDLTHPDQKTAIALVHSRYSTNTFPSWERAHPNRYLIHNGEINTLHGNVNWMNARKSVLVSEAFGEDLPKTFPVISSEGSDSAMFDNCFEFLYLSGRPLAHVAMMMIPEPWSKNPTMEKERKDFYRYHSCLMEPWDGPAAMVFTDGLVLGAILDRNGLRPCRYYVTRDDTLLLASEVGVLDIEEEEILCKRRLSPGRMLLVDTVKGEIIDDAKLKASISREKPYGAWLEKNMLDLGKLPLPPSPSLPLRDMEKLVHAFGYTHEEQNLVIMPMAGTGEESVGAMGNDIPLAVLSRKPQLLFSYFKQLFAQVTNPPIDAIREEMVTGTELYLGSQGNLLHSGEEACRQIRIDNPVLSTGEMERLKHLPVTGFTSVVLPMLFSPSGDGEGLAEALYQLFDQAESAISEGANILILSDRGVNASLVPIPSLLATSGLHHHLIRKGKRTRVSLVVESAEPREVHHFACLLGYGASAIHPYLAFEIIRGMSTDDMLPGVLLNMAQENYAQAIKKGIVKIMSKMGISTLLGYQGAQIFEALGIGPEVVGEFFTGTPSRIGGLSLKDIAREALTRHRLVYDIHRSDYTLDPGGEYRYRSGEEYHQYNPGTISSLQNACRSGKYAVYKEYSRKINEEGPCTLRDLFAFQSPLSPVPLEEVETVEHIVKRFKTGAMSYGSLSQEAHETLAIAMNRLGGKSNSGEGGEISDRFIRDTNGDSRCSAVKQVASGRFGVTSHYLVNAKEIQIKMAQGAKPGEGGQLPGKKVYPWIAKARLSTPGVGLISPPPHHDIYSIEDLAQLIHDLKMANEEARINVKLVSEAGIGTVAAGVAKGNADVILVSGYDGGTGAASRTSMKHAGLPWELGLAEVNQTLLLNNLRDRVVLETDGKLMTGRDVAVAALLGAEEYGFATAPLIAIGCVMMRQCNMDTCPIGIATQNPELRKNFRGKPEFVIHFMRFVAAELREIMAELGFRSIDEMVGRVDILKTIPLDGHYKLNGLDLSKILFPPDVGGNASRHCTSKQKNLVEASFDKKVLEDLVGRAVVTGKKTTVFLPVKNADRSVGTFIGSKISRTYRDQGLMEDTITLDLRGSAGQSFGAFLPKGVTLILEGDANDYVGKGLSGGKIIVKRPVECTFPAHENVIIGNVAFYGATSGEAYVNGMAGERFCVRNSGVHAVVEGLGDHGCEYMTGGRVVVLGRTGRNFAAGMSGGIAYVYDDDGTFPANANPGMVLLEPVNTSHEADMVRSMIKRHFVHTGSILAERLLDNWETTLRKMVRVIPLDFRNIHMRIREYLNEGVDEETAKLMAFKQGVAQ
ncbi:MAG: glutamate synthase large subunit [Clostridia bacterium]